MYALKEIPNLEGISWAYDLKTSQYKNIFIRVFSPWKRITLTFSEYAPTLMEILHGAFVHRAWLETKSHAWEPFPVSEMSYCWYFRDSFWGLHSLGLLYERIFFGWEDLGNVLFNEKEICNSLQGTLLHEKTHTPKICSAPAIKPSFSARWKRYVRKVHPVGPQ